MRLPLGSVAKCPKCHSDVAARVAPVVDALSGIPTAKPVSSPLAPPLAPPMQAPLAPPLAPPMQAPNAAAPAGTPGIVTAGFALSLLGCGFVGAILCIVGYAEAKRRGQGVGLATAGIVLGAVTLVILLVMLVISAAGTRSDPYGGF